VTAIALIVLWVGAVLISLLNGGCAPSHDPYLATRFEAFNDAVQAGLVDCRLDQTICEPTLELLAMDLAVWTDIMTDPNL
jgi:hypothetical protein